MDNENNKGFPEANDNEQPIRRDESSTGKKGKKKKTSSAANIDSIISSATENVRSRRGHADWSHTGTNISYEGQTALGGALGTGDVSGHSGVGASIHTDSPYDSARVNEDRKGRDEDLDPEQDDRHEEERDII